MMLLSIGLVIFSAAAGVHCLWFCEWQWSSECL